MKIITVIICFLIVQPLSAQENAKFEQIAFDYYLTELVDSNINGTLWTELQNFSDGSFWFPRCLENFKLEQNDSVASNISGLSNLELKQSEQRLKIKPLLKGKYPRIYTTTSYSNLTEQHIVNVVEIHKHHGVIYHVEMNNKGEVINWCKGGWIE